VSESKDFSCDLCGETPAFPAGERIEVCPTDRGDEVREFPVYLCDDCYKHTAL
jgi:hypothetical protein